MLDARIGVTPHELPIVFIDNDFFNDLSAKSVEEKSDKSVEGSENGKRDNLIDDEQDSEGDIDGGEVYREVEAKVGSGEFRAVDP